MSMRDKYMDGIIKYIDNYITKIDKTGRSHFSLIPLSLSHTQHTLMHTILFVETKSNSCEINISKASLQ